MAERSCLTCAHAKWAAPPNDYVGDCTAKTESTRESLPKAVVVLRYGISRKCPHADCPTWEAK